MDPFEQDYKSCRNKMWRLSVNRFWDSVKQSSIKQPSNLLHEKNIYLDEVNDCMIILGISPHERFSIAARIEIKSSASVLHLSKEQLVDLLDCVGHRFCENAVFPQTNRGDVHIQLYNERLYKVYSHNEYIKMSLNALLTLKQKRSLIKMYIKLMESDEYEEQLYKLLLHYCYDTEERVIVSALHSSTDLYKQQIVNAIYRLSCSCLEKTFALEVMCNCAEWFSACAPLFIKTLIQNEQSIDHHF